MKYSMELDLLQVKRQQRLKQVCLYCNSCYIYINLSQSSGFSDEICLLFVSARKTLEVLIPEMSKVTEEDKKPNIIDDLAVSILYCIFMYIKKLTEMKSEFHNKMIYIVTRNT